MGGDGGGQVSIGGGERPDGGGSPPIPPHVGKPCKRMGGILQPLVPEKHSWRDKRSSFTAGYSFLSTIPVGTKHAKLLHCTVCIENTCSRPTNKFCFSPISTRRNV